MVRIVNPGPVAPQDVVRTLDRTAVSVAGASLYGQHRIAGPIAEVGRLGTRSRDLDLLLGARHRNAVSLLQQPVHRPAPRGPHRGDAGTARSSDTSARATRAHRRRNAAQQGDHRISGSISSSAARSRQMPRGSATARDCRRGCPARSASAGYPPSSETTMDVASVGADDGQRAHRVRRLPLSRSRVRAVGEVGAAVAPPLYGDHPVVHQDVEGTSNRRP